MSGLMQGVVPQDEGLTGISFGSALTALFVGST